MEDFRSKSCGNGRIQIQSSNYNGYAYKPDPNNPKDLRCYSASYATSFSDPQPQKTQIETEDKFKKGNSRNGSSSSVKNWSFNDPEMQRKKRVASYKVYAVEGKVKGSFKKSFRWLKDRYSQMVYRWR